MVGRIEAMIPIPTPCPVSPTAHRNMHRAQGRWQAPWVETQWHSCRQRGGYTQVGVGTPSVPASLTKTPMRVLRCFPAFQLDKVDADLDGVSFCCSGGLVLGPTQIPSHTTCGNTLPKKVQVPSGPQDTTSAQDQPQICGSLDAYLGLSRDLGRQHPCPRGTKVPQGRYTINQVNQLIK